MLLASLLGAAELAAIVQPEPTPLRDREYRHPGLSIETLFRSPAELPADGKARAASDLARLGAPERLARLDRRSGRWATISPGTALVPGPGVGNTLDWRDLGRGAPSSPAEQKEAVAAAFRRYLAANAETLRIDPVEVPGPARITAYENGRITHLFQQRQVGGVPVRGSYLTAVVNSGNLVLFGSERWGDVDVSTAPEVSQEDALAVVQGHVEPFTIGGAWGKSSLALVALADETDPARARFGDGYAYRLVWAVRPSFSDDRGRWEALVDAHSGELISFEDTNHYATTRGVKGGVLPVSNDGTPPDGVEQAGWPMPFADVSNGGTDYFTDAGGSLLKCVDGTVTSTLSGKYIKINDTCGAINRVSAGNLDFGTSAGTDCATPGFGGAGNTHSARSGFHELNRMAEMARSHLPGNSWLEQQLTANMNINDNCNANWNGTAVNFFTSGGSCFNTGEIAGVFDHEWGHGMDDNDAVPSIASPSGEGVADIYAALRLDTSCIGRGFRASNCGGYGDPCLSCTGVRDIDYEQRSSGDRHHYTWSNANCSSVHCIGAVYSEAVWSLWKRKLQAAPYNMDNNTAHEVVNRLTFIGAGNTGTWFSGGPPFGGCAAGSGYLNYLAADDDNGNLADGTPHMAAIYDAFNDQQIACATPTVQDSGCAGTPATPPVVSATAVDRGASLSWGAVAGATSYEVFRTDGVFACDFGKIRVAETTGTSFLDSGLQNGRGYSYVVIPKGPAPSCFGPASACTSVTPAAGANLEIDTASAGVSMATGDGDAFVDACEQATVTFDIWNVGSGAQTNVRIDDVRVVSPPTVLVTGTSVSDSTLADSCGMVTGSFSFRASALSFGDTITFEVDVTSDELAPVVRTRTLTIENAETDTQFRASKTWDFESGLDGWSVVQGTFGQTTTGGGASGSAGYLESSWRLGDQCDQVRSPSFRPTSTTTVSTFTNYIIEAESDQWYDQANLGIVHGGARTIVDPDSGRLYNADGAGASCVTAGGNGWAGTAATWASSGWSATALGSAGLAGEVIQLDMAYGTDPLEHPESFKFDRVRVTKIELLVADAQSDVCGCFSDGDCDDGDVCTGTETCGVGGFCAAGTPPPDLAFSSMTISGPASGQSCGDLTVGPSVTISGGAVELRAGGAVVFVPPVTVDSSAILNVGNGPPDP